MSADVIGPCLSPWLMAIGHRLPFISFALLLYPSRSPTGAAPSGTASFIAVRSHGGKEGGGGEEEECRRRGDREKKCCREKPMEAMGRGRHARLSNLSR